MAPVDITILSVYVGGIILGAIGFGIWQRDLRNFDWWDDAIPAFAILLIWPLVVAFGAILTVVVVAGFIPCWIARQLMKFGSWIGNKYDDWRRERYRRKIEEEREREEQIQKNVKKMQKALKKNKKGNRQ